MNKCTECGGLMTTDKNAVRRYTLAGLAHVELHGVEVSTCKSCGRESIAIPRIAQLHRVLAESFVRQQRMLAPVEIRFLRKHVGLSSDDFAQAMGVTRETVSRWENGKTPMGPTSDRLLRMVVLRKDPTEDYAVEDFLKSLNDKPAPHKLARMAMRNSREAGWRPDRRELQAV